MKNEIIVCIFLLIVVSTNFISASGGGAARTTPVPEEIIKLSEKGEDYIYDYIRLQFEIGGQYYGLSINDIEKEKVVFSATILDNNNLSSYIMEESFELNEGDIKEIDFTKDGDGDVFIQLTKIYDHYEDIGEVAGFTLKKISNLEPSIFNDSQEEILDSSEIIKDDSDNITQFNNTIIIGEEDNKTNGLILLNENGNIFIKLVGWFKNFFR